MQPVIQNYQPSEEEIEFNILVAYIEITREENIALSRVKYEQTFLKNMSWDVCVLNKDILGVFGRFKVWKKK